MKDFPSGYNVSEAVRGYIEERNHFGWRLRGERAVKFAQIKEGDSVLDLCCGPGMVAKVISETVGVGGKVVGIDMSQDFINYAKSFCDGNNTSFIADDIKNINMHLADQLFDSAIILASWFWIEDKVSLCEQVKDHLKPDGKFLISISSDNLNDNKTAEFYWKYRENLKNEVLKVSPSTNLSYFDKLPVVDRKFITETVALVNGHGFRLRSENEVERFLTAEDKLYTYNNPARTEWVGNFSPDQRLEIIRKAISNTVATIPNLSVIKRHTYYLTFGLGEQTK